MRQSAPQKQHEPFIGRGPLHAQAGELGCNGSLDGEWRHARRGQFANPDRSRAPARHEPQRGGAWLLSRLLPRWGAGQGVSAAHPSPGPGTISSPCVTRRSCVRWPQPIPTSSISAAYPPDNVGIVRAANEIGLNPKMFGGAMIGMLITPIKVQLGPIANGLVIVETFVPSPKLQFAGLDDVMKRYQAKARRTEDRSARLRLRADRLRRRPDPRPGRHRDQEPRPRQARGLHAQPARSTPWSARSRSPRTANGRKPRQFTDAVPERRAEQPRPVPRRRTSSRSCGRRSTRPAT